MKQQKVYIPKQVSLRASVFRHMLSLMRSRFATITVEQSRRMGNIARFPLPRGTWVKQAGGIAAQWIDVVGASPQKLIVYLHGGGYCLNTPMIHHALLARLCMMTQSRGLYVDYRLAPEHVYPSAFEDILAAYLWVLDQNPPVRHLYLVGDSAGGGLAVAAMVSFVAQRIRLPTATALMSPWCDLTLTNQSAVADSDPIYSRSAFLNFARLYAKDTRLDHPQLSPINADLNGLSPVLIQVADLELLREDAVQLAAKLRQSGVQADLAIYQGLWHVWQAYPPFMVPETNIACRQIAAFLQQHSQ